MRNTRAKTKSISADSGVGNKGVKAGPRRTAKAAGFTILSPSAARRQPGRQTAATSGRRGGMTAPPPAVHDRRALCGPKGPATCRSHPFSDGSRYRYPTAGDGQVPRRQAVSQERQAAPGRTAPGGRWARCASHQIAPFKIAQLVQSARLPARKFGRGGPAQGQAPPYSREAHGGAYRLA